MRFAPLLVAMTACGRLDFDASGAGAAVDAIQDPRPFPACAGHDEDGDGIGDACDRCPTVADPGQEDRGELEAGLAPDDIGDACDPRPALPGDYVAYFAPFTTLPDDLATIGTIVVGSDVLRIGRVGGSGGGTLLLPTPFSRVAVKFTLAATASAPVPKWAGIWTHVAPGFDLGNAMFAQAAQADAAQGTYYMKEAYLNVDAASEPTLEGPTLIPGHQIEFTVDTSLVTGDVARLHAEVDGAVLGDSSRTIQLAQTGRFFLESSEMESDYAYLIVYAIH